MTEEPHFGQNLRILGQNISFLVVGCRCFGRTHVVFQGFAPELVLRQRTFALMNCEIFVTERPYSNVSIL